MSDDFADFVSARWPRLVRAAVLLGCSPVEAEDLVQASLERCLRHWGRVSRAADPDAYVHRILINGFVSSRRRRWTGESATASPTDGSTADGTERVDTSDAVRRALLRLPVDQRTAVVLRYYLHLGEAQMAAALGIPAGTVKSRLSRGLGTLRADPSLTELRGPR